MLTLRFTKTSTMNELIDVARTNKFKAAAVKEKETARAHQEALKQYSIPFPSGSKLYLAATVTYNRVDSDPDNLTACLKSILDSLVRSKLLTDDSFKNIHEHLYFNYIKTKRDKQHVLLHIFFDKTEYAEFITKSVLEKP